MKPLASSLPSSPRSFFRPALLASCLQALLAAPGLHAATYYWDTNNSTAGFGTAGGTWASPTTNDATQGWTTDSAGTSVLSGTTTTTTSDALNFGTAANQLGTGTITVSGAVSANTITIVGSSSNITLSGGNITLNAGLTATNSANTTAITETISSNITLGGSQTWTVNNGGTVGTQNLAVSGNVLGGANGLTKSGNGTLDVAGTANSWNGTTSVNTGTLTLSGNLSTTGIIQTGWSTGGSVLNITGNLTQNRAANVRNFVIAGGLNLNGTVNVSGSGILNAAGMFLGEDGGGHSVFNQSGGTVNNTSGQLWMNGQTSSLNVSGGVFNMGTQTLSMGTGTVAGGTNSTISVNGTGSITMGTLRFGVSSRNATAMTVNLGDGTAGGNLSISGVTYAAGTGSGPTTINFNGGTLNVRTTASMITEATTVVKAGGAILDVNSGQTFTIGNNLTTDGTGGGLTKNGTGTLVLSGAGNNYTGTTTVNAGTLTLGANQNLGAIAGAGALNLSTYTLTTNTSSDTTYSGVISGTGSLTKNGTGTLTLSNAGNTYTGTTTVNAGTLALGANQSRGAIAGAGALNLSSYTLTTNSSSSTTYSGVISGTGGSLTKEGTGMLTLSNTNTHSGSTTINAGTLQIDGNIANSGLVINSGAIISPGSTAAADSFGTSSITINGGSYNWTLNTANGSAGSGWDQITSTGALTSSGALTVYAYGTPGDWNGANSYSWDIISANSVSGFSAGNFALDFTNFGIAAGNRTGTWAFSNPSGGIIRLSYTASGDPAWTGGTGNWDTGFSPPVTEGDTIAFSGAGGTATNNISNSTLTTVNDIEFRNGAGAYTLAANAGSAGASGGMALTVNGSIINNSLNTQTINMDVAPGSIVINTGALEIGAAGRLNSGSYSNTITNSVSLIYSGTNAQTLSGDISGTGALTKNASSTLTLTGNNTYSGATTINAGALEIGGTGRLGGGSYAGNIVMTGAFTYNSTADQTLSGQISGAGAFNKFASSTLTLSGSNTRSGTLTMGVNVGNLTAGTVKLGHSNALGTGSNVWENDGTLELAANGLTVANANNIYARASATDGKRRYRLDLAGSNTGTFSGNFDIRMSGLVFDVGGDDTLTASGSLTNGAGGGGFEKTGTGTLVLTGATNTLNSNIVISAGTLQIGNGGTTGTLNSLAVTNNGTLVFNRSNAITVANAISGSGNVIKNASNTLTLTGSNTYSGGTTLNTGTLVIGNAAAAGTGTITQTDGTSVLKLDTTGTIANAMSIYNVVSNQTVTLSGAITAQNTTYDVADGTTLSINGSIGGSGGVTKEGNGTLELNAANTFTGDTEINFGTLEANATGSLANTGNIRVTGGSLLVGANNAIGDSTSMDLAGGTLKFSGTVSDTIGALTLSANSVIDLGTGSVTAIFADLFMGSYTLAVHNWTGTTLWDGGTGNNTDKIYFNRNLSSGELGRISFYSDFGSSFLGTGFQLGLGSGFQYEVIPVPEPETWTTAALLLIGGGVWMWRKRRIRI